VGLSVGSAAASVGLTAATLRTWDRRYGLSPSIRTTGGHRRYNDTDLQRLRLTSRLIEDGLPPAGAAQVVLGLLEDEYEQRLNFTREPVRRGTSGTALNDGGQDGESDEPPRASTPRASTLRAGGGRTIAAPQASDEQRGITRAALALDAQVVQSIMAQAIEERGAVRAWDELAAPTLIAIGTHWAKTASGVEIEHITSLAIQFAFDSAMPVTTGTTTRPVLLACAPDDDHVLALSALRAALAERGVASVLLGQHTPANALAAAVARLRPRAVVLWASIDLSADVTVLDQLPAQRPKVRYFYAGPGWQHVAVAPSAGAPVKLASLTEAVERLSA